MTPPFGMLVRKADTAPTQEGGVVLLGPILGPMPELDQPLLLRRPFVPPLTVRCAGTVHLRRAQGGNDTGLLLTGWAGPAASLVEGVLHGEHTHYSLFKTMTTSPRGEFASQARFVLGEGPRLHRGRMSCYGFIRMAGRLVDLHLLGEDSSTHEVFWQCVEQIIPLEGSALARDDLLLPQPASESGTKRQPLPPFPALQTPLDSELRRAS
jgi:hypothetical protein